MQTLQLASEIPGFCGLHLPNETKDVNKARGELVVQQSNFQVTELV